MNAPVSNNVVHEAAAAALRCKLSYARALLGVAQTMRTRADDECRNHLNAINAIKQEAYERGLSLDRPRREQA